MDPEAKQKKKTAILTGEYFSLAGITAWTVFDIRRSKANGLYPVKFKVTYLRERVYYPSGIDLSVKEWETLPITRKQDLIKQRELIQKGFANIKRHIEDLFKGDGFTLEALNKRLSRGTKNSIITAFLNKVEKLKTDGRIGNSIWYSCAEKSIENYLRDRAKQKHTEPKDLKFSDITPDWLNDYEAYLLDGGKSYNTISMYMRALRAIVNDNKDLISKAQYPFGEGKYEIPTGIGRKMALTLSQIGAVLKYPLVNDRDRMFRDLWFFSYLCNGININDMLRLKYSNIHEGEIRFYRQKTIKSTNLKKDIAAVLLPELQQIISKWGNPDRKQDSYIFPFLKYGLTPIEEKKIIQNVTRSINDRLYKIGKDLGYCRISTYTARHSFATVLKRSGANISFISESLGHSNQKTTEIYLDSFEKEERIKNAALLIPD